MGVSLRGCGKMIKEVGMGFSLVIRTNYLIYILIKPKSLT